MIKIRYACLPEGFHATAVARGRHATIYLRPGLDPVQRRDALQRLRRNARLGYAPPLPVVGVARAVAADRVLGTVRNLLAVVQCHPLGVLGLAGLLAAVTMSYVTLMAYPGPAGPHLPSPAPSAAQVAVPGADRLTDTGGLLYALVPLGMTPPGWRVPEVAPGPQGPARHHTGHGGRNWWRHHPRWWGRSRGWWGHRPGWRESRQTWQRREPARLHRGSGWQQWQGGRQWPGSQGEPGAGPYPGSQGEPGAGPYPGRPDMAMQAAPGAPGTWSGQRAKSG